MRVKTNTRKEKEASFLDAVIKRERVKQEPSHDARTGACRVTTNSLTSTTPHKLVLQLSPDNKEKWQEGKPPRTLESS